MAISKIERLRYQPLMRSDGVFEGGQRDYEARLRKIMSQVDFRGKRVLDLGCSAGFFSLSVANFAKEVTAVDGDAEMIQRNVSVAQSAGINNVSFIHADITSELIDSLGKFDIVLFLSVFHHMIVDSDVYEWGAGTRHMWRDVIDAISRAADTFVFEMGDCREAGEWAVKLANSEASSAGWVRANIFGSDYADVVRLSGCAYDRTVYRLLPSLREVAFGNRVSRKINRIFRVDERDFRHIYIGNKVK